MLIETLSGDLPRRLMGESEPAPTLIAPSAQAAPTRAPTRRFGVASVLGSAALGAGALAVVAPVSIASGLALIAAGLALLLISR
jgi:hypothetical protein